MPLLSWLPWPLASVMRDAQRWWLRLACPALDVVLPWFYTVSSATPHIHHFLVVCMIFGSVSWRQTWPNSDSLQRLTINSKSSWCLVKILTCCHKYSFVLYQASSFCQTFTVAHFVGIFSCFTNRINFSHLFGVQKLFVNEMLQNCENISALVKLCWI